MSLNIDLANALARLAEASDTLRDCTLRVSEARKAETEAVNRINEAQKEVDQLVMALKQQAPNGCFTCLKSLNWRAECVDSYAKRLNCHYRTY